MSRKNFGAKPYTYPQPVFILAAYDQNGKANAMNAAWGGISEEHEISICISADHKTTKNIIESRAFSVSIADQMHVVECDYLGIVSGNDVDDKMEKSGFTICKSEFVNAPVINELPICVECELISYNEESCILKGNIINVSVDESFIINGKVDISLVKPITFDPFNNTYNVIGDVVGKAFTDGMTLV